ncbi:hypothetical protein QE364_001835 [Nocardioides zeae]|uniref:Uncharacterized protein n=1 Tax=Nocardioides zeae TaxID=1457234 RepID=A0ACC6IHI5_9ACTN|nr:DUF6318 family protein [Nocardioides zeae]MDR6173135.1 hypothetical protein [Nocardioides zeae]MDR6210128.1 hypothetical protein [Nocardioides zeae]
MVGLVVGTSLLAACTGGGGESEEAGPWPSSSGSSESAAATSSSAATSAPAVPVMPEEARGAGDAAAVAFVEHWVELVNYAAFSGDATSVRQVTGTDCQVCQSLYASMDGQPLSSTDGAWSTSDLVTRAPAASDPGPADLVVTGDVDISGSESSPFGSLALGVTREDEGWRVAWLLTEQY